MIETISEYYKKTDQQVNLDKKDISRTIYEGLVFKFKEALRDIETITSDTIEIVYLTGGGSNNSLLCQWIADALNVVTVTGSPETTTAGNILMQLQAAGEIENVDEGREILSNSYELTYVTPNEKHSWDLAFHQYVNFLDRP